MLISVWNVGGEEVKTEVEKQGGDLVCGVSDRGENEWGEW